MKLITSKSNSKIQQAKKLLDKKHRDKTGLFLAETKKVIGQALAFGLKPVCLFASKDASCFDGSFDNVYATTDDVLGQISSTVTTDGFVAIFEQKKVQAKYDGGSFLILDNLQNPDNFGAILRTALASNFKNIFVLGGVDQYNPKTIRASMGNQFGLNIAQITYPDVPKLFANANLFVADMAGQNLFEVESFGKDVGFVVGNEGNGVSRELKDLIKNKICVPMQNGVESLNAGISASIIMYQIFAKQTKK